MSLTAAELRGRVELLAEAYVLPHLPCTVAEHPDRDRAEGVRITLTVKSSSLNGYITAALTSDPIARLRVLSAEREGLVFTY